MKIPKKTIILFLLIVIFASVFSVIISLTTDISLGDEVYHYRFAKNFYWQARRPMVDILYQNHDPIGMLYIHDIFWHSILALIWRLIGRISFMAAQFYQTLYYILLVFLTYLLGKKLYNKETGYYSALIVATVPMVTVFSVLFYTDVSGAIFSVLCVLLLIKRRYFWAGIALGLMYLSRRNTLFFFPAILFISFYYNAENFKAKLKNLSLFALAASIIILPDLYWREINFRMFPENIFTSYKAVFNTFVSAAKTTFKAHPPQPQTGDMKTFTDMVSKEFSFVRYFQRFIWVSYFGFGIFIALLLGFIYRLNKKKDIILWALIGSYLLFYFIFLRFSSEVRYMLPMIPFLSILAAIPLACANKRPLRNMVIFICMIQVLASVIYVGMKRRLPEALKAGFVYVRENTPSEANILYPEYVGLDAMNRRIKWSNNAGMLNNILWSSDAAEVSAALKELEIDYIFIKKSRIYDDPNFRYIGGFPKAFTERLSSLPFVKLAYENEEVSIWEVYRNK